MRMKSPTEPTGADSACLVLVDGRRHDLEQLHGNPLAIWQNWAESVHGHGIDSGHHIAKEAPEALVSTLLPFLTTPP